MDQLKDENKTLKDRFFAVDDLAHNYEEWEEKYARACRVYSADNQDDDYRQEILDAIKTLKKENTKLKITMKRISLLVAEQELDALEQ